MTHTPLIVKLFSLSLTPVVVGVGVVVGNAAEVGFGNNRERLLSSSRGIFVFPFSVSAPSLSIQSGRTHCGAAGFRLDLDETLTVETRSGRFPPCILLSSDSLSRLFSCLRFTIEVAVSWFESSLCDSAMESLSLSWSRLKVRSRPLLTRSFSSRGSFGQS